MFCNFMGLPQIGYELQAFPHRKLSECPLFSNPDLAVTQAPFSGIVFMYILGVIGYVYTMGNWTLDGDSLYWQDLLKRY